MAMVAVVGRAVARQPMSARHRRREEWLDRTQILLAVAARRGRQEPAVPRERLAQMGICLEEVLVAGRAVAIKILRLWLARAAREVFVEAVAARVALERVSEPPAEREVRDAYL